LQHSISIELFLRKVLDYEQEVRANIHQVEYLCCKLILKPNKFHSRESLFDFKKVLRDPAKEHAMKFLVKRAEAFFLSLQYSAEDYIALNCTKTAACTGFWGIP